MTTQINDIHNSSSDERTNRDFHGQIIAGVALIFLGLVILAGQFLPGETAALFLLPGLGLIFLVWGIASRTTGLLVPGGILTGLGVGVYLIEGPLNSLEGQAQGGVVLLAFAAGWALISLLAILIEKKMILWPLIPGGILGLIGGALLSGVAGLKALELAGQTWPIALIGFGLYLLVKRQK